MRTPPWGFTMSDDSLELARLHRRRAELRAERVRIANGYMNAERRGSTVPSSSDLATLGRIARDLAAVRTQLRVLERTVS